MTATPGVKIIKDENGLVVYAHEGEDSEITGILKDTGEPIEKAALQSFEASLCYNDEIINGRDKTSILDDNGGTVDATGGGFTLWLSGEDNIVVGSVSPEAHRLILYYTWITPGGAEREGIDEYELYVIKSKQTAEVTIKTDIDLSGVKRVRSKHIEVEAFDPEVMQRVRDKENTPLPSFCDVDICVAVPKNKRSHR